MSTAISSVKAPFFRSATMMLCASSSAFKSAILRKALLLPTRAFVKRRVPPTFFSAASLQPWHANAPPALPCEKNEALLYKIRGNLPSRVNLRMGCLYLTSTALIDSVDSRRRSFSFLLASAMFDLLAFAFLLFGGMSYTREK